MLVSFAFPNLSNEKNPGCLGYIGDENYPIIWGL